MFVMLAFRYNNRKWTKRPNLSSSLLHKRQCLLHLITFLLQYGKVVFLSKTLVDQA